MNNLIGEIKKTISSEHLNLENRTVFTEAASGPFIVTPIIAAMAGAEIYCVTQPSRFGSVGEVIDATYELAEKAGVAGQIHISISKKMVREADIVTNLGWVRPINRDLIRQMPKGSVIPLMYESWEFRPEDIDIDIANARRIPVMGTDEGQVFDYCGELAIKLLHDYGYPVRGTKVSVIGSDRMSSVVREAISSVGGILYDPKGADIRIMSGLFEPNALNVEIVMAAEGRMNHTLAELGPRPVIELNTRGLKVGAAMYDAKLQNLEGPAFIKYVKKEAPAQCLNDIEY
jgi:hypothetical protein